MSDIFELGAKPFELSDTMKSCQMSIPAKCFEGVETTFSSSTPAYQELYDQMVKDREESIFGGPPTYANICTNSSSTADVSLESLKALKEKFPAPPVPSKYILHPNKYLGSIKQVRFPKTKKKRIRRKWERRKSSYAFVPDPRFYVIDNEIVAHPDTLARIYTALGLAARPTQSVEIELLGFQADLLKEVCSCP